MKSIKHFLWLMIALIFISCQEDDVEPSSSDLVNSTVEINSQAKLKIAKAKHWFENRQLGQMSEKT